MAILFFLKRCDHWIHGWSSKKFIHHDAAWHISKQRCQNKTLFAPFSKDKCYQGLSFSRRVGDCFKARGALISASVNMSLHWCCLLPFTTPLLPWLQQSVATQAGTSLYVWKKIHTLLDGYFIYLSAMKSRVPKLIPGSRNKHWFTCAFKFNPKQITELSRWVLFNSAVVTVWRISQTQTHTFHFTESKVLSHKFLVTGNSFGHWESNTWCAAVPAAALWLQFIYHFSVRRFQSGSRDREPLIKSDINIFMLHITQARMYFHFDDVLVMFSLRLLQNLVLFCFSLCFHNQYKPLPLWDIQTEPKFMNVSLLIMLGKGHHLHPSYRH